MASEAAIAKDTQFVLVSMLPDVCLTPDKKGKPIPYPITHDMGQSKQCSPNVFFRGQPAYLHEESFVDNVKGDESGAGGGVVSGTHTKISRSVQHSPSVFINGQHLVRTGDTVWMNREGPTPAAPNFKPSTSTGLGESVDDLVSKSPTLEADLEKLKQDGWQIQYGPEGGGSYASRDETPPLIVLDGNLKGDPKQTVKVLSHEVGHATYDYTPDFSSRTAYLNGTLADEGAATMKNIQVQREVLANGGPNIGIAGNSANHGDYNAAYDAYLNTGDDAAARQRIGSVFGNKEHTSTTGQTYSDYYGSWYDETFGTTE